MARIPMGEFGQAIAPQRQTPTPTAAQLDGGLSEATQRLGNTAAAIGQSQLDMQAAEAERLKRQQEAEARQEAEKQARRAEQVQQLNAHADIQVGLADLNDKVTADLTTGKISKDDARKQWTEASQKLVSESVGKLPTDLGPLVEAQMKPLAGSLANRLEDNIRKRDQQEADAGLITYKESMQRFAGTDLQTAAKQWEQAVRAAGPGAGWTPEKVEKEVQGFKEQVTFTKAYEMVSNVRQDRKGLDLAEKTIQGMSDMDPQKRATLLDRVGAYKFSLDQKAELAAQRAQRQREASLKTAEAAFQTFQGIADKGLVLDPAYVDAVIKQTSGTPFQAGVVALAKAGAENGGLAAQPIAAQRAELDRINAQIAIEGNNPALQKRRDQIEKVVNASESAYNKDGLRAANQRGVIESIAPLDLAGGTAGISKSIGARIQQANVASIAAGSPVSPLLPEEAEAFGKLIRKLPEDARAEAVSQLAQQMPMGMRVAFAQQVGKSDRGLELAMRMGGARTTEGRATATLIFKGEQAIKDKLLKDDSEAVTGTRAMVAKELGDAMTGRDRDDLLDAAVRIYYGAHSEGQSINAERAIGLAVGGSVLEHNGRKVVIPAGINKTMLEKRLKSVSESEIETQSGKTVRAGGVEIPVAEFVKAIPGQQLIAVKPGKFAIVVNGRPATNSQGTPIVIGVN